MKSAMENSSTETATLTQLERDHYQALWAKLRAENAPLRVIENGTLVSAPISFFDAQLMSFVTRDWQKTARIIGEALVAQMDGRVFQAGDLLLAGRINRLVENGALECRGESPLDVQHSEIRLPRRVNRSLQRRPLLPLIANLPRRTDG